MTPPIPESISRFELDGYVNALTRLPGESRLFGTESLYGDWNGRCLLLAKDFACSAQLEFQIASWPRGYSHKDGMRANERLKQFSEPLRIDERATDCGLLYGSALGPLCRADGKMSGGLPNRRNALAFGAHVVEFTLAHMPSLRAIMCLGFEAWECVCAVTGVQGGWAVTRDAELARTWNDISIIAAFHPAARVSTARMCASWHAVYDMLGVTPPHTIARAA